jgi:small GTP-binding protein
LDTLQTELTLTGTAISRKKVCLLGDFAVGKTSLIRRFVHGIFDEKYLTTIGVTLSQKSLLRGPHETRLIIWDLAGGEDFSRSETLYLRGTAGALIICDLTRPPSLPLIHYYTDQLWQSSPDAAVLLVGNKLDLLGNGRAQVTPADLDSIAATLNVRYLLTSAKTGENVDRAFELLAEEIESR